MGKSLPNYITLDYYESTYLTKDFIIVNKNDFIDMPNNKNQNNDLNNNKFSFKYIYDNLKFW